MQLIRGLYNLRPEDKGCVLSIGNFDGLHLGHQALLKLLCQQAREYQTRSCLLSFEPLPHEYFNHKHGKPGSSRLMNTREKLITLQQLDSGLCPDALMLMRFSDSLAKMSAAEFIQRVLIDALSIRALVIGDDFRFGRGREGNIETLEQAARQHGFAITALSTHVLDRLRVSSTRVREALQQDRLADAARMLGREYKICGRVVHGEKRGRTIGFPTANIRPKRTASPLHGVYSVTMHTIEHGALPAIANLGTRPTVSGTEIRLEVHVFDFSGDLYGQNVCVAFHEKIRDELKFDGLDALKQQIAIDCETAKRQLKSKNET
jgi:riboflavin kinase/FMN adenylyltransferase